MSIENYRPTRTLVTSTLIERSKASRHRPQIAQSEEASLVNAYCRNGTRLTPKVNGRMTELSDDSMGQLEDHFGVSFRIQGDIRDVVAEWLERLLPEGALFDADAATLRPPGVSEALREAFVFKHACLIQLVRAFDRMPGEDWLGLLPPIALALGADAMRPDDYSGDYVKPRKYAPAPLAWAIANARWLGLLADTSSPDAFADAVEEELARDDALLQAVGRELLRRRRKRDRRQLNAVRQLLAA